MNGIGHVYAEQGMFYSAVENIYKPYKSSRSALVKV